MTLSVLCVGLAACGESPLPQNDAAPPDDSVQTECVDDGHLATELNGGILASLDWQSGQLACEGMQRPDDEGARLRFSGTYRNDGERQTLTFILAIVDLAAGRTSSEMPTNVTLVEEGNGRFFTTSDTDSCWTDVMEHTQISDNPEDAGTKDSHRISGNVYCISPLAEINGNASVTITDLSFTGKIDWGAE